MPANPAITILISMASAITPPSTGLAKTSPVPRPTRTAIVPPLSRAMRNSRPMIRRVFERVSSFIASARTETAIVWVPALPPIEATIGISTASATICSIAAPKIEITKLATSAVARLAISQRTRAL